MSDEKEPDFLDEIYKPTKHKQEDKSSANTTPHFERGYD